MPGALKQTLPPVILYTPETAVKVLVLTPFDEDYAYLRNSFHQTNWKVDRARSCAEAIELLTSSGYAAMVCEQNLPDGTWREMLEAIEVLPGGPVLIVASRAPDDTLWAEVLNLGGYDVLAKPFDRREIVRVLSQSWRHWKQTRATAAKAVSWASAP